MAERGKARVGAFGTTYFFVHTCLQVSPLPETIFQAHTRRQEARNRNSGTSYKNKNAFPQMMRNATLRREVNTGLVLHLHYASRHESVQQLILVAVEYAMPVLSSPLDPPSLEKQHPLPPEAQRRWPRDTSSLRFDCLNNPFGLRSPGACDRHQRYTHR